MKTFLRRALLLLVLLCAAALLYRAWIQRGIERKLSAAVDEGRFVTLNGRPHWISIRSSRNDPSNPLLLLIHGGPGLATSNFPQLFLPYEQHFTVVHWDQPGAGRTFAEQGGLDSRITLATVASDGVALGEWLRARFGAQRKIIVFAWSFGTVIGVQMVKQRPDLFTSYFGTGQVANNVLGEKLAYERVVSIARSRNHQNALAELTAIGPPPYDSMTKQIQQRAWATEFGNDGPVLRNARSQLFLGPRTSLYGIYRYLSGVSQSAMHFSGADQRGPYKRMDLKTLGREFRLPFFVIQGEEDNYIPAALARDYVEWIEAPRKEYIPIAGAGHYALISQAESFARLIAEKVSQPLPK